MFSKLIELIFPVLKKDLKVGLIAILIVVCIVIGVWSDRRITGADEKCAQERQDDKNEIERLRNDNRQYHARLQDFVFGKLETERKALENDSIIRKNVNKDINKVMP